LAAFRASRSNRTRQAKWVTRNLGAIDDDAFERKAIDASVSAAYWGIVLRKGIHAPTHGQIAHAAFAFDVRRAFNAKRLAIRFNGLTIHLRAELTIRTTITRRPRARIRRRTRLTAFPVALFAFRTILVIIAFVARFRNRIARESSGTIGIRSTSTAFDVAIEVHAEWRVATTR